MTVTLQAVTKDNFDTVLRLKPHEHQRNFVASNVYSIAQAKVEPNCVPLAVYAGETLVGFAMYALDTDDHHYWIYRLMVDAEHQGKGYGRAAVRALVAEIRRQPDYTGMIKISADPDNVTALTLYRDEGFVDTGEEIGGETVLCMK